MKQIRIPSSTADLAKHLYLIIRMSLFTENFHYSKIKFCLPYHPYHEKQNVKETFEYYVIKFRNINTRVIVENIYRGWSWIMYQNRTL